MPVSETRAVNHKRVMPLCSKAAKRGIESWGSSWQTAAVELMNGMIRWEPYGKQMIKAIYNFGLGTSYAPLALRNSLGLAWRIGAFAQNETDAACKTLPYFCSKPNQDHWDLWDSFQAFDTNKTMDLHRLFLICRHLCKISQVQRATEKMRCAAPVGLWPLDTRANIVVPAINKPLKADILIFVKLCEGSIWGLGAQYYRYTMHHPEYNPWSTPAA